MRTLIFGATGLLGPYLGEAAATLGAVVLCGNSHGDIRCDVANPSDVLALVESHAPDLVVNCIAYTNVDGCEKNQSCADLLNRQAVSTVVDCASPRLVQISTDQVYPGVGAPFAEDDTGPINVYGRSKLAGETEALRHPAPLVLRVNFFGPSKTPGRSSLSDWMIESLAEGSPMTLFEDSLFSPLHLETLAQVTIDAVKRDLRGVYNVGCRDGMSKADFGYAIARHLSLGTKNVRRGQSEEMPGRARRPKDMRMDVTRIETALGYSMPTMSEEISRLQL